MCVCVCACACAYAYVEAWKRGSRAALQEWGLEERADRTELANGQQALGRVCLKCNTLVS